MKLAIMQPYFMPYIGYWQLINAVDEFVLYDDVNYIKKGWINRNRLLENNAPAYFNINLQGASQNKHINELKIMQDERTEKGMLRRISTCYKKAPYYGEIYPIIEKIVGFQSTDLVTYLMHSILCICEYLEIHTQIIKSADIEKNNSLKGQDKILEICKKLGADVYYNPIGGTELYDKEQFRKAGMELFFIKSDNIVYDQLDGEFVPWLSIIDVLMFNEKKVVQEYLEKYTLV